MRNEMFITLERGEFEKGGKSVQKNVEVTMYVLDVQGDILPVSLLPRTSPFSSNNCCRLSSRSIAFCK